MAMLNKGFSFVSLVPRIILRRKHPNNEEKDNDCPRSKTFFNNSRH